jgi:hemolysin III
VRNCEQVCEHYDEGMEKRETLGDLIANAITHGVGSLLALVGAVYLIVIAAHGTVWQIVSCSIYAATLVLVYLCSTLYHSLARTGARKVFHVLDHAAIYLLIAGTYTPFTLVSLHGRLGWTLFGLVWSLAIAGVVFKSVAFHRFAMVSTAIYLVMGWLILFATRPLLHAISWHGMTWLAGGGIAYTAGVFFFAKDRVPSFHALWHVFVLAGSILHYFAVLYYVAPSSLPAH